MPPSQQKPKIVPAQTAKVEPLYGVIKVVQGKDVSYKMTEITSAYQPVKRKEYKESLVKFYPLTEKGKTQAQKKLEQLRERLRKIQGLRERLAGDGEEDDAEAEGDGEQTAG